MRLNLRRRIRTRLVRGLLDLVVLHSLKAQPMHGYRIIANLWENFGVDLGSSTVYPLLGVLEEKGYVESSWKVENERPRKVYSITPQGSDLLNSTEKSLNQMFKKMRIHTDDKTR